MMFVGVIVYSNILTELMDVLDTKLEKRNSINRKFDMMRKVCLNVSIPEIVQRRVKREIVHSVEFETEERKKNFIPIFRGVHQKDVDDLLYQAYTKKFRNTAFDGFSDKKFLIRFAQAMEEVSYSYKQVIYERGDPARHFYLIR